MNKTLGHAVENDAALRITSPRLFDSGLCATHQYGYGAASLEDIIYIEVNCIFLDAILPVRDSTAFPPAFRDEIAGMPVLPMTGSGDLTLMAVNARAERRQATACRDGFLPGSNPVRLRYRPNA